MKNIKYYFTAILTAVSFSVTTVHAAFNDAGTDYTDATTQSWIKMGDSMAPLTFASFLVCVASKTGASLVVNGEYNALVDISKCETRESSSKPEIANVTVTTSRADNSSAQIVKVWLEMQESDAYRFMVEASITEGVSSTAPYGSFTFNWKNVGGFERGSMSFTAGDTASAVKLIKEESWDGPTTTKWINGSVNNDKVTGQARSGAGADTYTVSFNADNVHDQKTGDAAACTSRTLSDEYVYGYNLYNSDTGAEISLSGPFQCTYDSSGTTKNCFIGPSFAWFEGGETTTITAVTRTSDSQEFTDITYDPADDGTVSGTANDGIYVTVPGATFDDPIVFTKNLQPTAVQTIVGNGALEYVGDGQLFGIPWNCSTDGTTYVQDDNAGSCDGANFWRPGAVIDNGTVLVGTSVSYVTKATFSEKVMRTADDCSALDLSTITSGDLPTLTATDDITDITITWADKPTVTDAPRIIDGVEQ